MSSAGADNFTGSPGTGVCRPRISATVILSSARLTWAYEDSPSRSTSNGRTELAAGIFGPRESPGVLHANLEPDGKPAAFAMSSTMEALRLMTSVPCKLAVVSFEA